MNGTPFNTLQESDELTDELAGRSEMPIRQIARLDYNSAAK